MTGLALRFPQTPGTPHFSRLTLSRLMRLVEPMNLLPRSLSMRFYFDAAVNRESRWRYSFE